jgi:hypothetical protein
MGKQRKEPSSEDLDPVREQIRAWRETRRLPGPMPSEIWDRAVVLARVFGVCKVARAVGLDYSALRKKVAKAMEKPGLVKPTFVELPGRMVTGEELQGLSPWQPEAGRPGATGTLIDISRPDGSRIRIQLEAGCGMEAAGILAAFMRGRD